MGDGTMRSHPVFFKQPPTHSGLELIMDVNTLALNHLDIPTSISTMVIAADLIESMCLMKATEVDLGVTMAICH
jgi:hypothetical protein